MKTIEILNCPTCGNNMWLTNWEPGMVLCRGCGWTCPGWTRYGTLSASVIEDRIAQAEQDRMELDDL